MALPLSPQVFAILSALVEEHAGLQYSPADRELFAEKVSARAVDQGFESLLDYYYFMRYDAAGALELTRLVEAMVVHETYFFREVQQLEWLVDHFLAPRCAAGVRPRVWSAACATGEEPLTLAMLLADRNLTGQVELVATDISERALDRARAGRFPLRSLRSTARAELASRYLRQRDGEMVIVPELHAAVRFERVNLIDRAQVERLGRFDAVVCRNALIYFRDEMTQRVVDDLVGRLAPDGVLLVGVSESLLRFGTSVDCEEHGGVFIYRPVRS